MQTFPPRHLNAQALHLSELHIIGLAMELHGGGVSQYTHVNILSLLLL